MIYIPRALHSSCLLTWEQDKFQNLQSLSSYVCLLHTEAPQLLSPPASNSLWVTLGLQTSPQLPAGQHRSTSEDTAVVLATVRSALQEGSAEGCWAAHPLPKINPIFVPSCQVTPFPCQAWHCFMEWSARAEQEAVSKEITYFCCCFQKQQDNHKTLGFFTSFRPCDTQNHWLNIFFKKRIYAVLSLIFQKAFLMKGRGRMIQMFVSSPEKLNHQCMKH